MNPFESWMHLSTQLSANMWLGAAQVMTPGTGQLTRAQLDKADALVSAHSRGASTLVHGQLSGAAAMLGAAMNPADPNFMRAWMGQDIYVR